MTNISCLGRTVIQRAQQQITFVLVRIISFCENKEAGIIGIPIFRTEGCDSVCFYLHPPFILHLCSFPPALPWNGLELSQVAATELSLYKQKTGNEEVICGRAPPWHFSQTKPFSAVALSGSHQSAGPSAGSVSGRNCRRIRENKSGKIL